MHITSIEKAFSLSGKNAIVTGGNRGIGLGITTALAHHGANVAILCRDEASAKEVIADLSGKYDGKYKFFRCDVTNNEECKAAVKGTIDEFGSIDILVNNSGAGFAGDILDMDEDLSKWFDCFDLILHGQVRMSYLVGKHMRDMGKGGRVINITSNAGAIVNKPHPLTPYSCAKAALNHLTKCLAHDWAKYGIRVNAIAPGYTHSEMSKNFNDEVYRVLCEKIPIGRFGEAIEIGALAVYLASDASDVMTGVVLTADGGYSLGI
jgi:NAD(P)-dependent dehydrogenase (short-subunit alcohol dehydrogenase family)